MKTLKWVILGAMIWCLVIGIIGLIHLATGKDTGIFNVIITGLLFFVAGFNFANFLKFRSEEKVRQDIHRWMKEEADKLQQEFLNTIDDAMMHRVSKN